MKIGGLGESLGKKVRGGYDVYTQSKLVVGRAWCFGPPAPNRSIGLRFLAKDTDTRRANRAEVDCRADARALCARRSPFRSTHMPRIQFHPGSD